MRTLRGSVAVAAVLGLLAGAGPAAATDYFVTNLDDSGPGSLRQAVLDANANPGADSITFRAGLTGTIQLTSGEIAITGSLLIGGPDARALAVASTSRIFNIGDGTSTVIQVIIGNLSLTGANATGNGGAILNNEEFLQLSFVSLVGNHASGEGGAIWNFLGTLHVLNSTIAGNSANKSAGILSIGGSTRIVNSTISGNVAADSQGGVHQQFGGAEIFNSTIAGNRATFVGGVLCQDATCSFWSTILADNTDITGINDINRIGNSTVNASSSLFEEDVTATGVINGTDVDNVIGVDPQLRPLANNGGPTNTQAIPLTSPALDAGSNPLSLADDQRGAGFPREVSAGVDIGAFELSPQTELAPALSPVGFVSLGGLLVLAGLTKLRRGRR